VARKPLCIKTALYQFALIGFKNIPLLYNIIELTGFNASPKNIIVACEKKNDQPQDNDENSVDKKFFHADVFWKARTRFSGGLTPKFRRPALKSEPFPDS
jgi:hypothetical protein